MICMVDVLSMFVPCLFQYWTWCDVQIFSCAAQFHQYQQQTYNTWLRISLDAAHLLFLVDANPVVLNMPLHVLTQGHNGRCCCLPSWLAASHVLQYFTSFVQLQFNFYHLLVACRYTCQWHWSTLPPGGTARLRCRWLWAGSGQDEVPQQLSLSTYQECTHQFNLTNTSCN